MGFMRARRAGMPHVPLPNDFPARGELMAEAHVSGTGEHSKLKGLVRFYRAVGQRGTVVTADISGLPPYTPAQPDADPPTAPIGPFGFHIHEHADCADMAMAAGGHYNPTDQPHGNHAGDLPVLFSNQGKSQMAVYTDRFTPEQVIGRAVVIHLNPDDYRGQPAGNSGARIACGPILTVAEAACKL